MPLIVSSRPIPHYRAVWHPVMQMWAIEEDGVPQAWCAEQGTARMLAQGANLLRRALAAGALVCSLVGLNLN